MSDYFGALMRSSGLAIGGRATATAHVEPSVVEIAVERSPPALQSRNRQTASPQQQQAVAPIPVARRVESFAPPEPLVAGTDAHEVQGGFTTPAQALPRAEAQAAADPAVAAASAVEAPNAAPGQTLVRAAMQWVAADPQQVALVVPPRGRSLAAVAEQTGVIATAQALREGNVGSTAQPPIAMAEHPAAPVDPTAREPIRPPELLIRSARPTLATPPTPVAPFARDEVVEISIGAIHVRVDAPAAQTVARPPATTTRAAAMPPRSALSRRPLRRI